MEFEIKDKSGRLAVSLNQDGNDVDIVVTDSKGNNITIAYLNNEGLTLCQLCVDSEIETNKDDYIVYQED